MRTISLSFTAGEMKVLNIPGKYFRILSSVTGTVDVEFFRNGSTVGEKASGVDAGYYGIPENGFDRVAVTSSQIQTIKFAVSNGGGGYDRTVGSVDVTNINSSFGQAAATVTTTSSTLLSGNTNRRAIIVQNNDAVGNIWINLSGAACTTANGIKIRPGEMFALNGFATSQSVTAIGDIASNANVVTSWG